MIPSHANYRNEGRSMGHGSQLKAFVAYPSDPKEIGDCIDAACRRLSGRLLITAWPQNDIAGRPLVAPIFEGIGHNDFLIADITHLNFNVTYEIGYAIGIGKRAYLIKHGGITGSKVDDVRKVGIFDTLGFQTYNDSDELHGILSRPIDPTPIAITPTLDLKAPLYILETPVRTEAMGRIAARVKKARLNYRSFNPSEHSRLSAMDAIRHVSDSYGVLIPLLSGNVKDSNVHNIRAAFVAGLAHGMQKTTLILQSGDDPVPLDIRDFVTSWKHPAQIDEYIESLARDIFATIQSADDLDIPATGLLASLSIGDPMAENEFQTLASYFVETDQYQRTLRGEVNLVVGRKGTGKTALFSQVRNRIRRERQNIVVDLKPEGYQLVKLKDDVLSHLAQGAKMHLISAFWEYLLYLEVCYKVLEKDRDRHLRDHRLTEPYRQLSAAYYRESANVKGDFSERLQELSDRISSTYQPESDDQDKTRLTTDEVTGLVHRQDIAQLRARLSEYLYFKEAVWILFDNLDKGWSPHGLTADDVAIVRSLIDASRKMQRAMQREGHNFHCVVFLRNDVYQLLVDETSDFGKEMKTSLDWNDPDLLRELVRMRLVSNEAIPEHVDFDRVWRQICVSHIDGSESSEYLIERSLMRPRNLLKILAHCRGSAVNLHHERIEEQDIQKGLATYSGDLLIEIDQELTDIDPEATELIYVFQDEGTDFSREDLEVLMDIKNIPVEHVEKIVEFLLYYGFLGIKVADREPRYIHDVGYDMKVLKASVEKHRNALRYVVNPAFRPALSPQ